MFVVFSCCVRLCMHAQGGALGRYVQRKLSGLKIFEEPFVSVRENLRTGIAICEQWVVACEHLTGQVWKSSKWGESMYKMIPQIKTLTMSVTMKHHTLIQQEKMHFNIKFG